MKINKILIYILIIVILGALVVLYFNKSSNQSSNNNSDINENSEEASSTFVNGVEGEKEFKKIVIPGLRIMSINNDSPLNQVTLVTLDDGEKTGASSLLTDDIITGISLDYNKTNLQDVIQRERPSKYFIPINNEQELYSEINKLKTNKVMLGVVRKVMAGTGYVYRPDIATFEIEKLEGNYLKATFLPNSKELYK